MFMHHLASSQKIEKRRYTGSAVIRTKHPTVNYTKLRKNRDTGINDYTLVKSKQWKKDAERHTDKYKAIPDTTFPTTKIPFSQVSSRQIYREKFHCGVCILLRRKAIQTHKQTNTCHIVT